VRQPAAFTLALVLAATVAIGFSACGGGDDAKLLPGNTAQEITENLDAVQLLAGEGDCVGAANAAQEVSAEVEDLDGVDAQLKRALERGAARLNEVVTTCQEVEEEAVAPAAEAPESEEEDLPPGQEKKAEKEAEKEAKKLEKEEEKEEKELPPDTTTTPEETTPAETPTTTPTTPAEGGGTGASGGVSPAAPVGEGE
jgi:outer membrane biosynthesis protein TonB